MKSNNFEFAFLLNDQRASTNSWRGSLWISCIVLQKLNKLITFEVITAIDFIVDFIKRRGISNNFEYRVVTIHIPFPFQNLSVFDYRIFLQF